MSNLLLIFFTGLLTGGITCMAVQGGLLVTLLTGGHKTDATHRVNTAKTTQNFRIVLFFVGAKIASHTVFGFLLGLFGSIFGFSVQFAAIVGIFVSFFMIGASLNMLRVHPIFRNFAITPPKFFRTLIWKHSKRQDIFAPLVVGALTVFVPCGTTQAMMAQAVGYGNPLFGAAILFAFTLGTAPLFILLGLAIGVLSEIFQAWFTKIAAFLLIGMAVVNIYFASIVLGVDTPVGRFFQLIACQVTYCETSSSSASIGQTTQTPVITIRRTKYDIDVPYIKAGDTITLTVKNIDGGGCIQFFTIPTLGIQKSVPVGKQETIVFTAPKEKGELPFMCSMGMYRGKFIVQ